MKEKNMSTRYIKNNEGIYCFDEYETDEKIVPTDFKIEKNRINVINLKIDFFENNNEILLECFDKNLEEVINFKIQAEDIVGIRNFGDIAGHSAIIDFVEQFENEDLKNSLINKVIDSKLDGWYIKNKNYIHNLFFIDSCYFEILTKFDISKNISMINSNEKNKEEIYVPLENKIMKSDNQLNIEKKYILEFKNLEVNEILKSELTLKYKKELVFMGITKKIIKKVEALIRLTNIPLASLRSSSRLHPVRTLLLLKEWQPMLSRPSFLLRATFPVTFFHFASYAQRRTSLCVMEL